jgi:hypothetical protein
LSVSVLPGISDTLVRQRWRIDAFWYWYGRVGCRLAGDRDALRIWRGERGSGPFRPTKHLVEELLPVAQLLRAVRVPRSTEFSLCPENAQWDATVFCSKRETPLQVTNAYPIGNKAASDGLNPGDVYHAWRKEFAERGTMPDSFGQLSRRVLGVDSQRSTVQVDLVVDATAIGISWAWRNKASKPAPPSCHLLIKVNMIDGFLRRERFLEAVSLAQIDKACGPYDYVHILGGGQRQYARI